MGVVEAVVGGGELKNIRRRFKKTPWRDQVRSYLFLVVQLEGSSINLEYHPTSEGQAWAPA